jgi:hypothetical protein
MSHQIRTYLAKRANLHRHKLESTQIPANLDTIIVIPAIAEETTLPLTLESVANCNRERLENTLVIITINNRTPDVENPQVIDENQRTLAWLQTNPHPNLHLAPIDASSPGLELSKKEGVGSARKIGMDHAANLLLEANPASPLIISLDADTIVRSTYLDAFHKFASSEAPWAGVMNYAHSMPEDPDEKAAIIAYELFLRYQDLGLHYARSPYAFHTIGSTIACTPEAYAAVSGMNKRKAGEDFYFLQQLAKTGTVTPVTDCIVIPSPRVSWRVPFGTGKRVGRFIEKSYEEYMVYHPDSYEILKRWFELVSKNLETSGEFLIKEAAVIHTELAVFLNYIEFESKWIRLQSNTTNARPTLKQFHCLFDAFQTMKLLHHLRDTALPDQNIFVAFEKIFAFRYINLFIHPDIQEQIPGQFQFLQAIRKTMGNDEV